MGLPIHSVQRTRASARVADFYRSAPGSDERQLVEVAAKGMGRRFGTEPAFAGRRVDAAEVCGEFQVTVIQIRRLRCGP